MADSKLSALAAGGDVQDADLFYSVQDGAQRKVTGAQIKAYTGGGGGVQYLYLPDPLFGGVLDQSGNTDLLQVNLNSASFETVNFTGCTSLIRLDVSANTLLTGLDVSSNLALTVLRLVQVTFTSIDISTNLALTNLNIGSSAITSVDVAVNTALTDLNVSSSAVSVLDINSNAALVNLDISGTSIAALDISNNPQLLQVQANGAAISDEADIDAILVALDGFGLSDGLVDLSGGTNATPGTAGQAAASNLTGKGWSVTTN